MSLDSAPTVSIIFQLSMHFSPQCEIIRDGSWLILPRLSCSCHLILSLLAMQRKCHLKLLIARESCEILTEIYCSPFVMYLHSKVTLVARKHIV